MTEKFSKPEKESFELSPLGAAVVEAMPDQKKVRAIQRAFKQKRVCPTSLIFTTAEQVSAFYRERGQTVQGV